MRLYILIILSIFLVRCASQGAPSGGAVDESGPIVVSIDPLDSLITSEQTITITFNEYLDQSSVASSITINGEHEFNMKVRYNKIIISPLKKWENINELYISRNIRDYQNNTMDSPMSKIFSINDSKMFQGKINGDLINIVDDNIYEVGLYSVINNQVKFMKKIEADKEGVFRFENIPNGEYRIGVIEGKIIDFQYDYRVRSYGINSQVINISNEEELSNIKIMISGALPKLNIVSGYLLNGNHAILKLSDGEEKSFFIESDKSDKKYINGDIVSLAPYYYNRLESYLLGEYEFITNYKSDTLAPSIDNIMLNQDKLNIYFSEPIRLLSDKVFVDSNQNHINHTMVDPFVLTAKLKLNDTSDIYINSSVITDYENNKIDSILNVDVPAFDINKKFGSLKGKINYNGAMDIVIKLIDNDTKEEYFISTSDSNFLFKKVPQGKYLLESYEKKHSDNEIYYSGVWEPFEKAAQIVIYPDLIDIRAHWEVQGIEIDY